MKILRSASDFLAIITALYESRRAGCGRSLHSLSSPSPHPREKYGERECTTRACITCTAHGRFAPSPCEIPARLRDGTMRGEGGVRGQLTVQSSRPVSAQRGRRTVSALPCCIAI